MEVKLKPESPGGRTIGYASQVGIFFMCVLFFLLSVIYPWNRHKVSVLKTKWLKELCVCIWLGNLISRLLWKTVVDLKNRGRWSFPLIHFNYVYFTFWKVLKNLIVCAHFLSWYRKQVSHHIYSRFTNNGKFHGNCLYIPDG